MKWTHLKHPPTKEPLPTDPYTSYASRVWLIYRSLLLLHKIVGDQSTLLAFWMLGETPLPALQRKTFPIPFNQKLRFLCNGIKLSKYISRQHLRMFYIDWLSSNQTGYMKGFFLIHLCRIWRSAFRLLL